MKNDDETDNDRQMNVEVKPSRLLLHALLTMGDAHGYLHRQADVYSQRTRIGTLYITKEVFYKFSTRNLI